MKPFWLEKIVSACPLTIQRVDWDQPQLTIGGKDWSFNAVIPWRMLDSRKLLMVGSGDEGFETAIRNLVGCTIVGCTAGKAEQMVDPCFHLMDGTVLEFFSDCSLEPWTMKLPLPPWLVASPSDPDWMR